MGQSNIAPIAATTKKRHGPRPIIESRKHRRGASLGKTCLLNSSSSAPVSPFGVAMTHTTVCGTP